MYDTIEELREYTERIKKLKEGIETAKENIKRLQKEQENVIALRKKYKDGVYEDYYDFIDIQKSLIKRKQREITSSKKAIAFIKKKMSMKAKK